MWTAAIRGDFGYYEYIVGAVCEGRIFALLRDGNGNTQCYRYEVSDPEKRTLLYETAENISLVQYQDGYLYLMENQASQISTGKYSFKRIAADAKADAAANAAEAQNALFTVEEEPGMTNDFSMYGNFYVTGNQAYCQQFKDYGVYLGEKRWMMRQAGSDVVRAGSVPVSDPGAGACRGAVGDVKECGWKPGAGKCTQNGWYLTERAMRSRR